MSDPLDPYVHALRQPASPTETAGESIAIDAIAAHVRSTQGSTMRFRANSRRLRVASMVAAGVVGFGGVAAAGPAAYDTVTGEDFESLRSVVDAPDTVEEPDVVPASSTTSTTSTTVGPISLAGDGTAPTTDAADGEPANDLADGDDSVTPLVDDPDTDFDETLCADGNHGRTVSSIAHETPSGPGKGAVVSEAAKSSCGKIDKDADLDASDDQEDDADESEDGSDKPDKPGKPDKPDKSDKPGKPDKPDKTNANDTTEQSDDQGGDEGSPNDEGSPDDEGSPNDDGSPNDEGDAPGRGGAGSSNGQGGGAGSSNGHGGGDGSSNGKGGGKKADR